MVNTGLERFKDSIKKGIAEYNKYRSPEAKAELLKIGKDTIIVKFTGSYCRTCGVYDYFEDLIYDLMDHANLKFKILKVEEKPDLTHIVTFKLNNKI